ncbi:hypothetical protein [Providencia sp. PROV108]|uniref:hypothetical protein n=1 Tax=Providencia sp. PROV108 TaxID=2949820 RepID=UPI0023498EFC|nr:hypothetical protein [Providencia sp. PROV108]
MSFIVYVVAVGFFIRWMIKHKEKFILNEESLHKQWLFRLAILFPLMSSLYFMFWLGSSYPFRWDAIGYNGFLEINKFSLGILALSPILGAFIVYAHRSIQTAKQIEVTEQKNKVDIYFAKRKFINEQLLTVNTIHEEKITRITSFYFNAFTISGDLNDKLNERFLACLELFLIDIDKGLKSIIELDEYLNKSIFLNKSKYSAKFSLLLASLDVTLLDIKKFLCIEPSDDHTLSEMKKKLIEKNEKHKKDHDEICENIQPMPEQLKDEMSPAEYAETKFDIDTEYEFYSFMKQFIFTIDDMLNIINEVFLIILPNENFGTKLPTWGACIDKITIILEGNPYYSDKYYGDKLAAKNQNPPE